MVLGSDVQEVSIQRRCEPIPWLYKGERQEASKHKGHADKECLAALLAEFKTVLKLCS